MSEISRPTKMVDDVVMDMTDAEIEEHQALAAEMEKHVAAQQLEFDRQTKEAEVLRSSTRYSDRVIAYVDILGWGAAIETSASDPELVRAMGSAQAVLSATATHVDNSRKLFGPDDEVNFQTTQFSDTIIISCLPGHFALSGLVGLLKFLTSVLLSHGMIIRGYITSGELYHRDGAVFGPALLAACQGEAKAAVYPRIVIDPALVPSARQYDRGWFPDTGEYYEHKIWRVDDDGKAFLDFLQPFGASTSPKVSMPVDPRDRLLLQMRELVVKRMAEFRGNEKILPKYFWLAKYVNSIIDEYPEIVIPKISL